jgi:NAD(P)H dehydrogenase (quinone)
VPKILILYWSAYGHIEQMAKAVAEGARSVEGAEVTLRRVPELSAEDEAKRERRNLDTSVPVATVEELAEYDAIVFGTPTRFGNMAAQMRAFLDRTGQLWVADALVGKVGSVFTSSNTQHGGQESTILTFIPTLLHQGMVVVGLPYSCKAQTTMDEISGGSPYGASTIAGGDGSRQPSENELGMARFQGEHVARIAKKLARP